MGDHRDLEIYRRAMALALRIHAFKIAHRRAPKLASQLKRCSQSIATNIAEGYDRTPAEFAAKLRISIGESRELEHHLEFGSQVGAITSGDVPWALREVVEIRKMMYGMIRYLGGK